MNVIYISAACSTEKFAQYSRQSNAAMPYPAQKYNLLLAEGLAANGAKVTMVSSRPINRAVEKRLWLKGEHEQVKGVDFFYLPFLNYPGFRQLFVFFETFWNVLFYKGKKKDTAIACDALNAASALGALCAAFFRGFRTVSIVTDIPGYISFPPDFTPVQKLTLAIMRRFDSYLLLTEQMSEIVNPQNRPYIVLEGHADMTMASVENILAAKAKKKICLYAGSLMEIYGIGNLVEGFLAAAIPEAELHIYGDGDYADKLRKQAAAHENICYHGIAPNAEIVKAELAATLLVNPRPTNEEYTKYSFPSKNMEYMASGTPVLTTRLPGMPEDHKRYVYFIEQENAQGIAHALKTVLSQDAETLHAFGARAKEFILKEKSNHAQAARVMEFVKITGLEQQSHG